jgi:hypothetical protein
MKEQKEILQDVINTSPPKEESKTKKYIRITLASVGMALFVLIFVTAALKKCGG